MNTGLATCVAVGQANITATVTPFPAVMGNAQLNCTTPPAFAIVNHTQPTNPFYSAGSTNTSGGTVDITRTAVGTYSVAFNGLGVGAMGTSFAAHVNAKSNTANAGLAVPFALCGGTLMNAANPVTLSGTGSVLLAQQSGSAGRARAILGGHDDDCWRTGLFGDRRQRSLCPLHAEPGILIQHSRPRHDDGGGAFNGFQIMHGFGESFPSATALAVSTFTTTTGVACGIRATPAAPFTSSDVVCFSRAAGPVNVIHQQVAATAGRPAQISGHAFVQGSNGALQTLYSFASAGNITSVRTAVGRYTVTFNGLNGTGQLGVFLSPWGLSGWIHCAHFYNAVTPIGLDIACFNAAGAFADPPFFGLFIVE
jgi:hypothetical protein